VKTSNIQVSHHHAIIKGWVDPLAAASSGGDGGNVDNDIENASGGDLEAGDVVVVNSAGQITTTTTAQDLRPKGVVLDDIASGEWGPVAFSGPVDFINTGGASVTAGHWAQTSTVAGEADSNGLTTPGTGSFAYFTSTSTTPSAFLVGPGGATTTASSGGLPWFNVQDYGAVADGSTDDRAAINLAIAALNSAGAGVLYFPAAANKYVVSTSLTTITVPCTIMGDGTGISTDTQSMISFSSTSATCFTVSAAGSTFKSLTIIQEGGTATAGAAIVVTNATLDRFEDLYISKFFTGIDIEDSLIWAMAMCYLENARKYGIRIRNSASPDAGDWSISDTVISTNFPADAGVRIETSGGGKLFNVKVNGSTGTDNFDYGIDLAVPTSVDTSILLISSCSIENVSEGGIRGTTAAATSKWGLITVIGCQFAILGNTAKAISLVATTAADFYGVVISGNLMSTAGTARSAMTLTKVDNVVIRDNVLFGFNDFATVTTVSNQRPFGAAMPTTPILNERFYRTDHRLEFFWDGTRWLCTCLHVVPVSLQDVISPLTGTNTVAYAALDNILDLWIEKIVLSTTVLTTNNGTNFWTVAAVRAPSGTSLGSFSTGTTPDTAGTNTRHNITVNAASGTSDRFLNITATKTLSPGNIYVIGSYSYRYIGT
jgi:hypothetical protein